LLAATLPDLATNSYLKVGTEGAGTTESESPEARARQVVKLSVKDLRTDVSTNDWQLFKLVVLCNYLTRMFIAPQEAASTGSSIVHYMNPLSIGCEMCESGSGINAFQVHGSMLS
jgi:hypothetical protein